MSQGSESHRILYAFSYKAVKVTTIRNTWLGLDHHKV